MDIGYLLSLDPELVFHVALKIPLGSCTARSHFVTPGPFRLRPFCSLIVAGASDGPISDGASRFGVQGADRNPRGTE